MTVREDTALEESSDLNEDEPEAVVEESDDDESVGSPELDLEVLTTSIVDRVSDATSREIDRRVTGLMKTLKTEYGLERRDVREEEPSVRTNVANQRVLRSALRDRVSLEFDDKEERRMASQLAKDFGEARGLGDDEDEDVVAEAIVGQVKAFLDAAREQYSAATKGELERRGLLKDDPPTQPLSGKKGKQGPSDVEAFRSGAAKAQEKFGSTKE